MPNYLLGLGSSHINACSFIQRAYLLLDNTARINIKSTSDIYFSPSQNCISACRFANAVLLVETTYTPHLFLQNTHLIESKLGRRRVQKNSPRTIDIDILWSPEVKINASTLKIPHGSFFKRDFTIILAIQALKRDLALVPKTFMTAKMALLPQSKLRTPDQSQS